MSENFEILVEVSGSNARFSEFNVREEYYNPNKTQESVDKNINFMH